MPDTLALTRWLNSLFGGDVALLMQAVGVHPANPAAPINDDFALESLVACGLIAFFLFVRLTLSVEKPNPAQQIAEAIHGFTGDLADQVIGHGYERFQAFAVCIGLFVLINNLIGLLPGIVTPTSHLGVPLGLAVLTFIYYNFHGVREQGVWPYIKHFAGPVPALAFLMFPIEIVSHLARLLSLSVRLYANMFASDLLTMISFSIVPLALPDVFLALHFGVAFIQAFVFMLLSMIYVSAAVAHEH
jgi:F-type H+-transporting ATPase subunit a